jgi:multimeric flavodoxin WrbA
MALKVLGISGSPVKNSNTDKLVKTIIEATGLDAEFFKLSDIDVKPCIACRKCVCTNVCVLNDDFKWLSEKILEAKALVIGSPVMYNAPSAFTKSFIERLYSLRHVKLLTQGKIGASVAVGEINPESVTQYLSQVMMMSGMEVVGSMTAFGNPGCFNCGAGEKCQHSIWNSVAKRAGTDNFYMKAYAGYLEVNPDNDPFNNPSYHIIKHRSVTDDLMVINQAKAIGHEIGNRLVEKQ